MNTEVRHMPHEPRKTVAKHLTPELLECLDYLFPTSEPTPGQPIDKIMYLSGQHSVVKFLIELHEEAQNNILD
jgi:hypothetical protein